MTRAWTRDTCHVLRGAWCVGDALVCGDHWRFLSLWGLWAYFKLATVTSRTSTSTLQLHTINNDVFVVRRFEARHSNDDVNTTLCGHLVACALRLSRRACLTVHRTQVSCCDAGGPGGILEGILELREIEMRCCCEEKQVRVRQWIRQ